jgi:hypothetical protein
MCSAGALASAAQATPAITERARTCVISVVLLAAAAFNILLQQCSAHTVPAAAVLSCCSASMLLFHKALRPSMVRERMFHQNTLLYGPEADVPVHNSRWFALHAADCNGQDKRTTCGLMLSAFA